MNEEKVHYFLGAVEVVEGDMRGREVGGYDEYVC